MTQMDVGCGGVEADFDRQWFAARDLRLQIVLLDQIDRALGQVIELFVEGHEGRIVAAREFDTLTTRLYTAMSMNHRVRHHHYHHIS